MSRYPCKLIASISERPLPRPGLGLDAEQRLVGFVLQVSRITGIAFSYCFNLGRDSSKKVAVRYRKES